MLQKIYQSIQCRRCLVLRKHCRVPWKEPNFGIQRLHSSKKGNSNTHQKHTKRTTEMRNLSKPILEEKIQRNWSLSLLSATDKRQRQAINNQTRIFSSLTTPLLDPDGLIGSGNLRSMKAVRGKKKFPTSVVQAID